MRIPFIAVLVFITSSFHATASDTAIADVVKVVPRYTEISVPKRDCHVVEETVLNQPVQEDRGIMGAVIGGVAGGILGNQVGKGSGKTAATAVAAGIGAIVGDRVQNQTQTPQAPVRSERCETRYVTESREEGFNVTYRLDGNLYTTMMNRRPGSTIRVRLMPVE